MVSDSRFMWLLELAFDAASAVRCDRYDDSNMERLAVMIMN